MSVHGGTMLGFTVYSIVMLGTAAMLYRFPLLFANWLLRGTTNARTQTAEPQEWYGVGCKLLGLWFIGNNVPSIASTLISLEHNSTSAIAVPLLHLLSEAFGTLWGIVLLIGWRRISAMLTRDTEPTL